jgi:four helix bundle protein
MTNSKQQTANIKKQTASVTSSSNRDPFDGVYLFKNLAVWQRAQELADEVLDVAGHLPNTRAAAILIQQVVKSSSSIAANIAEGHGRFSAGAYRNYLSISRGSTTETIGWIDLLRRRGWIDANREHSLLSKCAEIMRMLTAKMKELDAQTGTNRRLREDGFEYALE